MAIPTRTYGTRWMRNPVAASKAGSIARTGTTGRSPTIATRTVIRTNCMASAEGMPKLLEPARRAASSRRAGRTIRPLR